MSDHTVFLTVTLNKDYRVDDAEDIIDAIKMVKGVLDVAANVADPDTYVAYVRAKAEIQEKLFEVLKI